MASCLVRVCGESLLEQNVTEDSQQRVQSPTTAVLLILSSCGQQDQPVYRNITKVEFTSSELALTAESGLCFRDQGMSVPSSNTLAEHSASTHLSIL